MSFPLLTHNPKKNMFKTLISQHHEKPTLPPKKSSTYLKTNTKLKSPKTNKKPQTKPNVMIKSPNLSIEWNHRRRRHRHVGSAEQKSVWDIPRLQRIHELDRQREKYAGDLQQATRVESMDGWMTNWWGSKTNVKLVRFPK